MGAQLAQFYSLAKQQGGLQAQIKLAVITKMPSSAASAAVDSVANVRIFEAAMKQL